MASNKLGIDVYEEDDLDKIIEPLVSAMERMWLTGGSYSGDKLHIEFTITYIPESR